MRAQIGERVGAIQKTDPNSKTAVIFGYGVYDGEKTHPIGIPNPHITLDNGQEVWGCECWWGPEKKIQEMLEGFTVEVVDTPSQQEKGIDN